MDLYSFYHETTYWTLPFRHTTILQMLILSLLASQTELDFKRKKGKPWSHWEASRVRVLIWFWWEHTQSHNAWIISSSSWNFSKYGTKLWNIIYKEPYSDTDVLFHLASFPVFYLWTGHNKTSLCHCSLNSFAMTNNFIRSYEIIMPKQIGNWWIWMGVFS